MLTSHAFRLAAVLVLAGASCRFILRHVETRWQIIAFWVIVLTYQLVLRPMTGKPISLASAGLDLVGVTIAIVAVKFLIEGKITP